MKNTFLVLELVIIIGIIFLGLIFAKDSLEGNNLDMSDSETDRLFSSKF